MRIKIGKMYIKNPIMVASGTFGYAKEFERLMDLKELGAVVTKTITLTPKKGNPMPRICETPSGMLNSIGLQNEGLNNFIEEKLPYLKKIGVPVVVSISGDSVEEFFKIASRLDREDIDAIELNISCPNLNRKTKRERLIAQDKDATYELVRAVRAHTDKTLITKLSPNVTDIVEIAEASTRAGTDAVSLVNTFLGMAIDIKTGRPKLGNVTGGLSGPCIKPIAIRMVWEVAKNIDKPVIGIGGIMSSEDAIEFLLAGAKAVQVGTANFIKPDICREIIKGVKDYIKNKGHLLKKGLNIAST